MFGDGNGNRLKKAAAVLGFGAIVAGATQLPEPSQYSTKYDLKASLDEVVAPSTAAIHGSFAGLEARGATLTDGQADIRDRITARYEEIKAADHKGWAFEQLDAFSRDAFGHAKSGYLTAQEVAERGSVVLAADDYMKDYAAGAQSRLEGQGLDAQTSQSIVAGMIGTELLRDHATMDYSPEGFIADAPFSDEIKAGLTRDISTIRGSIGMVVEASNTASSKVQGRALEASLRDRTSGARDPEEKTALVQAKAEQLAAQRGATRPVARSEIDARSDRIRERALALAVSKRPKARSDRDDPEL